MNRLALLTIAALAALLTMAGCGYSPMDPSPAFEQGLEALPPAAGEAGAWRREGNVERLDAPGMAPADLQPNVGRGFVTGVRATYTLPEREEPPVQLEIWEYRHDDLALMAALHLKPETPEVAPVGQLGFVRGNRLYAWKQRYVIVAGQAGSEGGELVPRNTWLPAAGLLARSTVQQFDSFNLPSGTAGRLPLKGLLLHASDVNVVPRFAYRLPPHDKPLEKPDPTLQPNTWVTVGHYGSDGNAEEVLRKWKQSHQQAGASIGSVQADLEGPTFIAETDTMRHLAFRVENSAVSVDTRTSGGLDRQQLLQFSLQVAEALDRYPLSDKSGDFMLDVYAREIDKNYDRVQEQAE